MKKQFVTLLFTAVAIFAISCSSDVEKEVLTGESLMRKSLKARGGAALIEIDSFYIETTMIAQGMNIPMKAFVAGDETYSASMNAMGQDILFVKNKENAWLKQGGAVQELSGPMLSQFDQNVQMLKGFINKDIYKFDTKSNYTYKGIDSIDNAAYYHVALKEYDGADTAEVEYYLSAETYYPMKLRTERDLGGSMQEIKMEYSDYKKLSPDSEVVLPHKMNVQVMGQNVEIIMGAFEIKKAFDPKLFEKPE